MPQRPLRRRRRRVRVTIGIAAIAAILGIGIAGAISYLNRPSTHQPGEELQDITSKLSQGIPEDAPWPRLTDVTSEAGITFETFSGWRSSQLPEDMGSGAAWGDFDNDGDDDLFLVSAGGALGLPKEERAPSQLYENLGDGSFRVVEDFPTPRIMGMGAAWGDANGDGWSDLIVTGYDVIHLYLNEQGTFHRDGRFPQPPGFWAGPTWGDFDNDRDLDLYVCGYVKYMVDDADRARASQQYGTVVPYTLNPSSYQPERNLLFRNNGEGAFTEVAEILGVANTEGRSLGALWHDFNDDGWLDLYVANDISDNALFLNREGTFEDISHPAWVADYRGAMGLAAGDWDRDGDDDLFITHWIAQENALYDSRLTDLQQRGKQPAGAVAAPTSDPSSDAPLRFTDVADREGLGQIALHRIGWGSEFVDLDGDGWLDLVVSNGSTFETEELPKRLRPQSPFLFWNRRGEGYHNLIPLHEVLATPHVGRGLAVSDYDLDGDMDVLIMNHGERAQLLRNDMQTGNWLKLRLRSRIGRGGGLFGNGEGSKVIATVGNAKLRRSVTSSSYLSQSSKTLHFGLGEASRVEKLEVRWLGGDTMLYRDLEANAAWELMEGDPTPRQIGPKELPRSRPASLPENAPETEEERARLMAFWAKQRAATRAMKVEGDIPKAIRLYEEALELNPSHEDSLYYLGNLLAGEGELDEALARLQQLMQNNPQSHRAHRQYGILRATHAASQQDLEAAEEALTKAHEINLEETGALLALGEVALLQGRMSVAKKRFALACRSNPQAVGGLFLHAYIAWTEADRATARALLGAARKALGPEWKPEGTVAEGDVQKKMHIETTPLSRFWQDWDGASQDLAQVFNPVHRYLNEHPGRMMN